jgi:hypothetical protein
MALRESRHDRIQHHTAITYAHHALLIDPHQPANAKGVHDVREASGYQSDR